MRGDGHHQLTPERFHEEKLFGMPHSNNLWKNTHDRLI